ncbi:MAG: hypothetical protein JKX84_09995 [Flavobacteriales bacterium]|nr:hypothetical protein [Flavobacteriales bacterium]
MPESNSLQNHLKELVISGEELRKSKYGREQIKAYRKIYVECVENLAAHISSTKNKRLGDEAKQLLHFNKVYRNMQLRTGILAASIALAFVLIVYLYMMKETNALYAVSGIAAVGSFFMIRYTTQFSAVLDKEVQNVSKVSKRLIRAL